MQKLVNLAVSLAALTSFSLGKIAHDAISDRQRPNKVIAAKADDDDLPEVLIQTKVSPDGSGLHFRYSPPTIINDILKDHEPQIYHSAHVSALHSSATHFNIFPLFNVKRPVHMPAQGQPYNRLWCMRAIRFDLAGN